MFEKLKDQSAILWIVAFAGVCVLIGLDKVKPETLEYLLFAMGGAIVGTKKQTPGGTE